MIRRYMTGNRYTMHALLMRLEYIPTSKTLKIIKLCLKE